jgi:hypothetical protein
MQQPEVAPVHQPYALYQTLYTAESETSQKPSKTQLRQLKQFMSKLNPEQQEAVFMLCQEHYYQNTHLEPKFDDDPAYGKILATNIETKTIEYDLYALPSSLQWILLKFFNVVNK